MYFEAEVFGIASLKNPSLSKVLAEHHSFGPRRVGPSPLKARSASRSRVWWCPNGLAHRIAAGSAAVEPL